MSLLSRIKEANWTAYNIAFLEHEPHSVQDIVELGARMESLSPRWLDLDGYDGGWFADPFILAVYPDRVLVLAEEMHGPRGRISLLTVSRPRYTLMDVKPVLELDTHLSFPIYIEDEGVVYIYPENYQGGGVTLYRYHPGPASVSDPVRIIDDPLLDTQIARVGDMYYAFGVMHATGDSRDTRSLRVYSSPRLLDRFSLVQTLETDRCQERGAGRVFSIGDALLRPAQKCDHSYGEATIIKRLTLAHGRFAESDIAVLRPRPSARWGMALHTYNFKDGITVIDGLDYKHPLMHKALAPVSWLAKWLRGLRQ